MSDSISLVFTEGNIRVHAAEADMRAIILTRSGGVKKFVVLGGKGFSSVRISPNPISERILDCLLFLLCQGSFFFIEDTLLLTICIFNRIIDTNIFQIQRFLQNPICVGSLCTVGDIRRHIVVVGRTLTVDAPLCGQLGELDLNGTAQVIRGFKGFLHELLNIIGINPCCTQTHINLGRIQVLRLCFLQGFYIDAEGRISVCRHLCDTQLAPYITGKVLVGSLPSNFHSIGSHRVFEDHPSKLCLNRIVFSGRSKQLCHKRQIHLATLTDGDCQSFRRRIHARHSAFRLDGSLGEHIRLTFQIAVLIHIFQRTQEIVGGIVSKCLTVGSVIDKPVLCGKRIVGIIQFCLFLSNHFIRVILKLIFDQLVDDTTKFHHAHHTVFCFLIQVYTAHQGVFTEVHIAIHHGIREILYIRGCRNGFDFLTLASFGKLHILIGSLDVGNCFFQKFGQFHALNRTHRNVHTVGGTFFHRIAQNHFRMSDKVAVYGVSFFGAVKVYPFRNDVNRMVTLLQEQDVGHDFRACVFLKGVVWQTDCTKQFRPLRHISPCVRVLGIHGVTACHKSDHTTRTNLIQSLGEEIVVNGESQLVIRLIGHFIVAERDIAHSQIVEISAVCRFKASHFDFCIGIELLSNSAGDGIQFHTIQAAALHFRREHTKEVADTHSRLQNISRFKAYLSDRIIDGANDRRAGVMCIQGGSSCRSIFIFGKQVFQCLILLRPISLVRVKSICQTAPTDIIRQNLLFFGSGVPVLAFQFEQSFNGCDVSCEFLLRPTFTDVVIRDVEVHRRNRRNFSGGDGLLKLSDNVHDFGILPSVHLGIILNDGILSIYALYEVQTTRQISGIHCTQGFSLRVRKCIVGSQGIIKGTVFLDVQRTPLLNVLGNIKMVDKVFRLLLFGFRTDFDLCVCLFVRVVPIDTDALMLLLIVNGSTIVLESVILHGSVHIALGSFFRFFQSVVVQFIIEAVFKVMVGGN